MATAYYRPMFVALTGPSGAAIFVVAFPIVTILCQIWLTRGGEEGPRAWVKSVQIGLVCAFVLAVIVSAGR